MSEIQISKTLLILKANANSTAAAEQFLRNREWVVFSTTNLKDFLTHIIQKKPSFVMISVDHPNKKVLMMPKVLTSSFPICVFAFAENSSSVTFRKLQDVVCAYKINPPATGPAIERTVNKYLRDQEKRMRELNEKPQLDANGKPIVNAADPSVTVIQSGASGVTGDASTQAGGGWDQASNILSQLLAGDENGGKAGALAGAIASGDSIEGGNGTWVPVEGSAGLGDSNNPAGILPGSDFGEQAGGLNGPNVGGYLGGQDQSGSFESNQNTSSGAGTLGKMGDGNSMPGNLNGNSSNPSGSISYNDTDFEDDGKPRKLAKNPQSISIGKSKDGKKDNATAGTLDDVQSGKLKSPKKYEKEGKIITILGRNTGQNQDSIILKGTKQALDQTVQINDGVVKHAVQDSSQVACIVVESEKFNGYLIAALGKNRKMDGPFIKAVQDRLFKFLKENGENVADKESLNLKIKKVEFEDWALEYAEFLKKSVHNGDEIAMAFFPIPNARTEVGESASATMASVKLSEMEGDKQVEFNMYLYLPSNKKYILYTPKGGKFYSTQKGRLEEKGVKEVHMLKSEVNDLAKYKAQNYLNTLIESYKQKKSSNAA